MYIFLTCHQWAITGYPWKNNGKRRGTGEQQSSYLPELNLNHVIADAAWGNLKLETKAVAKKLGLIFTEVNPRFSSQECNCCGHVSKTNRKKERFLCEKCGYLDCASNAEKSNF